MVIDVAKRTFPIQEVLLRGVQKILMISVGVNFWVTFYLSVETVIHI